MLCSLPLWSCSDDCDTLWDSKALQVWFQGGFSFTFGCSAGTYCEREAWNLKQGKISIRIWAVTSWRTSTETKQHLDGIKQCVHFFNAGEAHMVCILLQSVLRMEECVYVWDSCSKEPRVPVITVSFEHFSLHLIMFLLWGANWDVVSFSQASQSCSPWLSSCCWLQRLCPPHPTPCL